MCLALEMELDRGVTTWGCAARGDELGALGWSCWRGAGFVQGLHKSHCYDVDVSLQGSTDPCAGPAGCKESSFGFEEELQQLLDMKTPSAPGQGREGFSCILRTCRSLGPDVPWTRGCVALGMCCWVLSRGCHSPGNLECGFWVVVVVGLFFPLSLCSPGL